MPEKKQTHINVLLRTQRQISILASVRGKFVYELIETWANQAWESAKKEGLVTDAMLQSQTPSSNSQKKTSARALEVVAA